MNILSFVEMFPDENSCKEHFRNQREQEGIKCKKMWVSKALLVKGEVSMAVFRM